MEASILLIFDNRQTRLSITNILQFLGFCVYCSDNETDVINILTNKKVDYIIYDPLMPTLFLTESEKNCKNKYAIAGEPLYQKIKELKPDQKIIFLSVANYETLIEEGLPVADNKQYFYYQQPYQIKEIPPLQEIMKEKVWKLHFGKHGIGIKPTSSDIIHEHSSFEDCEKDLKEIKFELKSSGYHLWFAYVVCPDGKKIILDKGIPL